ncbi:MAG TPA: outer-membrane lipoprotein carrier protein LolA [Candidatus Limnocylindrales bacterium]|nr:outer-membrane lipoprotein carrier protein LolA [Candidatus Limnocylindrales bacterium]
MRFTLTLFFVCLSLPASAHNEDRLLRNFESRYSSAQTLSAKFLERYREGGRLVRVEAGDAYFRRPGKMRWDYQAPERNTFLVDGKYVWFYAPSDHTATRMPAKQSEDLRTPLAFLTTHMKLSKICSQVEHLPDGAPAQSGGAVFRCTLRENGNARRVQSSAVLFEVSESGELSRIVIPQEGGIEIEFSFAAWEWNPKLDNQVFEFTPPRDTVIVDGVLPDAPGLRQ